MMAFVMVISMISVPAFAATGTTYQDGTYTKTSVVEPNEDAEFSAYDISVDVVIEGGTISSVAFSEGNAFGGDSADAEDNEYYSGKAMNGASSRVGVAEQIIANNGVEGVDTVSSATCSSNAILSAVAEVLEEAAIEEEEPAADSGYVLMNIPYDEFYAAEGVEGVDAVTTATVKTYNQNMAAGSYHDGYEAADPISEAVIEGITYPVYVEDMSVLEGLTQVKAEDTATITVASGKRDLTTKEVSGADLLFASGDYAYYIMEEAPNAYKTLSVNADGSFRFSAVSAEAIAAEGMEVEMVYAAHYTDIEFNVTAAEITDTCVINAITLTTSDGEEHALRHVEDIWRKTSLGWNWDSLDGNGLAGKTIVGVTYYIEDEGVYSIYEYEVNETVKLNPGEVTAEMVDANTIVLTGLPEDIENAAATVQTKVGRGETPTVVAENVAIENNTIVTTDAMVVHGTIYTVKVISDNYGDTSTTIGDLCAVNEFTDVAEDAWYHEAVDYVLNNEIMNGNGDGTFAPETALNRAMMVQILYNIEGRPAYESTAAFADVAEDAWYYDAVMWAASEGIVNGYSESQFGPNDVVTREQMVTILWRYEGEPAATAEITFADAADISDWAEAAVAWAVENGVVEGVGNNLFNPTGSSKRAEVAQMFMNYLTK